MVDESVVTSVSDYRKNLSPDDFKTPPLSKNTFAKNRAEEKRMEMWAGFPEQKKRQGEVVAAFSAGKKILSAPKMHPELPGAMDWLDIPMSIDRSPTWDFVNNHYAVAPDDWGLWNGIDWARVPVGAKVRNGKSDDAYTTCGTLSRPFDETYSTIWVMRDFRCGGNKTISDETVWFASGTFLVDEKDRLSYASADKQCAEDKEEDRRPYIDDRLSKPPCVKLRRSLLSYARALRIKQCEFPAEYKSGRKWMVAECCGGLMEDPEFWVDPSGIEEIVAPTPRAACRIYNKRHNCSYFYATCVGVDGVLSNKGGKMVSRGRQACGYDK